MTFMLDALTPYATPLLAAGVVGLILALAWLVKSDEPEDRACDTRHEREARR